MPSETPKAGESMAGSTLSQSGQRFRRPGFGISRRRSRLPTRRRKGSRLTRTLGRLQAVPGPVFAISTRLSSPARQTPNERSDFTARRAPAPAPGPLAPSGGKPSSCELAQDSAVEMPRMPVVSWLAEELVKQGQPAGETAYRRRTGLRAALTDRRGIAL